MKNSIRIISAAVLTAVYCLALGIVINSLAHTDFQRNATSSQQQYFSDFSTKLFCHTTQSQSAVNSHNKLPNQVFKSTCFGVWTTLSHEHLFETAFAQYATVGRNKLILHRKTDIIFPFHYYW